MDDDIDAALDEIENRIARQPKQRQHEYIGIKPASPVDGDFYFDTDSNEAFVWNGEKWLHVAATMDPVYAYGSTTPVAWVRRET